jgi:hypothetical protein
VINVAIIGSGPSGLLAAHAASLYGHIPSIFSKTKEPSPHAAATFLHRSIPDLTDGRPDSSIKISKLGSERVYAEKVYGDPERKTSWAKFRDGYHDAWALAPAYEDLWGMYSGAITELEITPTEAHGLQASYPLVFNTAPLPCLCESHLHRFDYEELWIVPGAPDYVERNMMIYNGFPPDPERMGWGTDAWTRSSDIFGTRSTEFRRPLGGAVVYNHPETGTPTVLARPNGQKVVETNCNCHPNIVRAGRWGTWKPGILIHQAFEEAQRALLKVR